MDLGWSFAIEMDRTLGAEVDRVVQDADAALLANGEHGEEPGRKRNRLIMGCPKFETDKHFSSKSCSLLRESLS